MEVVGRIGLEAMDGYEAADTTTETAGPEWRRSWWLHPGLGVEEMPGKGRGVVALERLEPGTVIAREWALGAALVPRPDACTECGLPGQDAACPECGVGWCGPLCEARALEYHWLECGESASLVGAPGSTFRMALRVFFATPRRLRSVWDKCRSAVPESPLRSALDSTEARLCLAASLPSHRAETKSMPEWAAIKRRVRTLARRIHQRLRGGPDAYAGAAAVERQLTNVLMVGYTNAFYVYRQLESAELGSPPGVAVGSGFFPGVSLLNHSCLPNTGRHFVGTRMEMRIIRPVEPGGEVTTTYGADPRGQTTAQRQARLTNWCFVCACPEACGSADFRTAEAEYWGFACGACDGPALPLAGRSGREWSLEDVYRWSTESGEAGEPWQGSLPVRCQSCGAEDRLAGAELERMVTALRVIRKRAPFRADLAQLVSGLHRRNHRRLVAEWTAELGRCQRRGGGLDDRALAAMAAVTGSVERLAGGPFGLDVADDAVEALRLLLRQPAHSVASLRRAAQFRDTAHRILANHYGPDSVQATRLADLVLPTN